MVASTNHLDLLDPGLSNRPSRFDRKYLFPLPSNAERILYCDYWRRDKLKSKPSIEFPQKLCPAIASITHGFSFAYLKEAFVATLLVIAGHRSEPGTTTTRGGGNDTDKEGGEEDEEDLDKYELWREMKTQVRLLREEMSAGRDENERYQVQDPTDLAAFTAVTSQSSEHNSTSPPLLETGSNILPSRRGASRASRNVRNRRVMGVGCDSRYALLMTDDGMLV